jgi:ABC-2 type transport system ATP-binding protein
VAGEVTPALLAGITSWCAARDVLAEGLSVERQSLEDVFLALTVPPNPSVPSPPSLRQAGR